MPIVQLKVTPHRWTRPGHVDTVMPCAAQWLRMPVRLGYTVAAGLPIFDWRVRPTQPICPWRAQPAVFAASIVNPTGLQ